MKIIFAERGWEDYLYWQTEDRAVLHRTNILIEECRRTPFTGRGRPEPLKANFAGSWSRRVSGEHRLIYQLTGSGDDQVLKVAQCRYHYTKKPSGNR